MRPGEHVPPPDPRLEAEADRLLAASAAREGRGEYPFYSQRWLERRERLDVSLKSVLIMLGQRPDRDAEDPEGLTTLMNAADLGPRERQVALLLAEGGSERGIASRLDLSRAKVRTVIRHLRRKLQACPYLGPCPAAEEARLRRLSRRDIRSVFKQYRDRFIYRAPICCQEGQESCRRTGLCDKRWYLFYV